MKKYHAHGRHTSAGAPFKHPPHGAVRQSVFYKRGGNQPKSSAGMRWNRRGAWLWFAEQVGAS